MFSNWLPHTESILELKPVLLLHKTVIYEANSFYNYNYKELSEVEAICSSETSIDFQRTTRRNILQDSTILKKIPFFLFLMLKNSYFEHCRFAFISLTNGQSSEFAQRILDTTHNRETMGQTMKILYVE
jgi:hypothetical protein